MMEALVVVLVAPSSSQVANCIACDSASRTLLFKIPCTPVVPVAVLVLCIELATEPPIVLFWAGEGHS